MRETDGWMMYGCMTDPRGQVVAVTDFLFCSVLPTLCVSVSSLFVECFPRAQCHSVFSCIDVLLFLIHASCRRSSIVGLWRIHVTTSASLSLLRYLTALSRASCQKKPPKMAHGTGLSGLEESLATINDAIQLAARDGSVHMYGCGAVSTVCAHA